MNSRSSKHSMSALSVVVIESLPAGKDRADLLDYVRSNFQKGFERLIFEPNGLCLMLFSNAEYAQQFIDTTQRSTSIAADFCPPSYPDLARLLDQRNQRSTRNPSNPVLRIPLAGLGSTTSELEKIMKCYRGYEYFQILEDEDTDLSPEEQSQRSLAAVSESPYVSFRDLFCAENALADIQKFTNITANFALNPERIRRLVPEAATTVGATPIGSAPERAGRLAIDLDLCVWLVVSKIPDDVSVSTLRQHFARIPGFLLLSFQPSTYLLAFSNAQTAEKAIHHLQTNTRMEVRYAEPREKDVFKLPHMRRPVPATAALYIRIQQWMPHKRFSELLRVYPGFEDARHFKDHIITRFATPDDATKALEDLEATTDLFVDYSSKGERLMPLNRDDQMSSMHPHFGPQSQSQSQPQLQSHLSMGHGGSGPVVRPRSASNTSINSVSQSRATVGPVPTNMAHLGVGSQIDRQPGSGQNQALLIADAALLRFNLRETLGSLDGFERFSIHEDGVYVWFVTREHLSVALGQIENEWNMNVAAVDRSRPRDRNQYQHNEVASSSLFIRNVPGLSRDMLQMIIESYPGAQTTRSTLMYTIVDFCDHESAKRALLDLRRTTNIKVEYSNRPAHNSGYGADPAGNTGPVVSVVSSASLVNPAYHAAPSAHAMYVMDKSGPSGPSSDNSQTPEPTTPSDAQGSVGSLCTAHLCNMDGKDKADIVSVARRLPGFVRLSFSAGAPGVYMVFQDAHHCNESIESLQQMWKKLTATFAKREPELKPVDMNAPRASVLTIGGTDWTLGELEKYLSGFPGFERVERDDSNYWAYFQDVDSASACLMEANFKVNLGATFASSPRAPPIKPGKLTINTANAGLTGGMVGMPMPQRPLAFHPMGVVAGAPLPYFASPSPSNAGGKHHGSWGDPPQFTRLGAQAPPNIPMGMYNMAPLGRPGFPVYAGAKAGYDAPNYMHPTSVTGYSAELAPVYLKPGQGPVYPGTRTPAPGEEPRDHSTGHLKGNVMVCSNLLTVAPCQFFDEMELQNFVCQLPGLEEYFVERHLDHLKLHLRFAGIDTAIKIMQTGEFQNMISRLSGGLGTAQFRSRNEAPLDWFEHVQEEFHEEGSQNANIASMATNCKLNPDAAPFDFTSHENWAMAASGQPHASQKPSVAATLSAQEDGELGRDAATLSYGSRSLPSRNQASKEHAAWEGGWESVGSKRGKSIIGDVQNAMASMSIGPADSTGVTHRTNLSDVFQPFQHGTEIDQSKAENGTESSQALTKQCEQLKAALATQAHKAGQASSRLDQILEFFKIEPQPSGIESDNHATQEPGSGPRRLPIDELSEKLERLWVHLHGPTEKDE
ncbi:uncharacterized protein BJ171DRAFT_307279 [Polychytrium aggregatum]|uniref:uncharacterized protein n=1 Tax=Polychytrium aggregatum TaxID=110093 RepID=UPI0022FEF012|nr:uncharacterized protein BJ171DRAFT_307279 [Polychytrium aggregatum]KAI9206817.1 hypothetical protein BJ171DRAFT_307279 [Polychytrium aggregatum]